jgi:nucleotide-binding universal stress UspA family protein
MKTILVPTDFSETARNAAEYAIQYAQEINAKVKLLHVFHAPIPVAEDVPVMVITPDQIEKVNETLLQQEVEYLRKKTGVKVEHKSRMGFAVYEIVEEEKNSSLIVMGMHGSSKFSEALLGSTTTSILKKVTIPVLIIPQNAKYKRPEKIVFACDYDSRTDVHALDFLKEMVKPFNSKIYVVNVKDKDEVPKYDEAFAGMLIEDELCDVNHGYYFSENEDLVEGINQFVSAKNADMVTIIPHRYNFMDRLFHTSMSKKLAFHTHVPLLALPYNHKVSAEFLI